ncbi:MULTISPECIES: PaaI family thioesterase [Nocardia]|uniref:PaaI family thioesterase n=1 Tax=Nocardia TaxID=1817 RepID=UPI0013003762|nr:MULTISPECIES: hotdog domain-containing protein [Nocardia]
MTSDMRGQGSVEGTAPSEETKPEIAVRPDHLFRVQTIAADAATSTAVMDIGPWLHGLDGNYAHGSLGVLADIVFGHSVFVAAQPHVRAVTTELLLEFCDPVTSAGGVLTAEGTTMHVGKGYGAGAGVIRAEDGTAIATGMVRLHFFPGERIGPARAPASRADLDRAPHPLRVLDMDLESRRDAADLRVRITREICNPGGGIHGGISVWLSELAAAEAVGAASERLRPTSLHITYLRHSPVDTSVTFAARVEHRTNRSAVVRVVATRENGGVGTEATIVYRKVE